MFAVLLALAACSSDPPPPPTPGPAADPAAALAQVRPVVSVSEGVMLYNGRMLDVALEPRDERYIPALREAIPEDADELDVAIGAGVTWRPVRRVMLTAGQRGVSAFWFRWADNPSRGPLRLPSPSTGEPSPGKPAPIGLLKLHQRGDRVWLNGALRFRGLRPQACADVYPGQVLQAACQQGSSALNVLGSEDGCLVPATSPEQALAEWPALLGQRMGALGADASWSWVLLVDTSVDIGILDSVLGAIGPTSPAQISLGGASETRVAPIACEPTVTDATGVALAGARWLGAPTE